MDNHLSRGKHSRHNRRVWMLSGGILDVLTELSRSTPLGFFSKRCKSTELGFGFCTSRRKGVLTEKDLKKRLAFSRQMITKPQQFWTKDVAFYLDGVSFVYKTNRMRDMVAPNPRIWRKRNEELKWTAKGSKGLAGGKRLHLLVAICFGKGVILAEPYQTMNAEFFSRFIQRHLDNKNNVCILILAHASDILRLIY